MSYVYVLYINQLVTFKYVYIIIIIISILFTFILITVPFWSTKISPSHLLVYYPYIIKVPFFRHLPFPYSYINMKIYYYYIWFTPLHSTLLRFRDRQNSILYGFFEKFSPRVREELKIFIENWFPSLVGEKRLSNQSQRLLSCSLLL